MKMKQHSITKESEIAVFSISRQISSFCNCWKWNTLMLTSIHLYHLKQLCFGSFCYIRGILLLHYLHYSFIRTNYIIVCGILIDNNSGKCVRVQAIVIWGKFQVVPKGTWLMCFCWASPLGWIFLVCVQSISNVQERTHSWTLLSLFLVKYWTD